jgi:hypothetical protein
MQDPQDAQIRADVRSQLAPEIFTDDYGVSDEQAAQALAENLPEFSQSPATYEAIAKFNFVQRLTAKRTMRDNSRRTKILAGNDKIASIIGRFNGIKSE